MQTWIVLYDGGCGFCRWSVRRLLRLDRHHRLYAAAIQSERGAEALAEMPPDRRLGSWHLRSPDGRLYSAGAAVPVLLRLLPGGRWTARIAARFPRSVDRLYALVSRNRGRLGRFFSEPASAVDAGAGSRGDGARTQGQAGARRYTGPDNDSA